MKKITILLIDDDKRVLDIISDTLDLSGYHNQKFTDPIEAVNAYKTGQFDIVITDLRMPGMDGIDVLKRVRAYNPNAYVIILTGYANSDNNAEAKNHGAYAFFEKPLDLKSFLNAINIIEEELSAGG